MSSDRAPWVSLLASSIAAIATAVAAAWFWAHPSPALIGTAPSDFIVPWYYQACAFPPLGLLVTTAVADLFARRTRQGLSALALCGACSLFALVRLAGLVPLSGHGLFLSAVIAFELGRGSARARGALLMAALGLMLTCFFKLAVWHDGPFFLASVALGGPLGWAVSAMVLARPQPGR